MIHTRPTPLTSGTVLATVLALLLMTAPCLASSAESLPAGTTKLLILSDDKNDEAAPEATGESPEEDQAAQAPEEQAPGEQVHAEIAHIAENPYAEAFAGKPSPAEALALLQAGNARFAAGRSEHPHTSGARLIQAGQENQGDHAYATVISCSDSRVPVERVFDAGVMDIFVIRVAGNVVQTDEAGSIEYGLAHVHTPVLVVLGHTQCGAVTAVTNAMLGHGHELERNIPPLVAPIQPAVERAMSITGQESTSVIPAAIIQNVYQGIEDLFMQSPATRQLVHAGLVKVVGGIYDVSTGRVEWLSEPATHRILREVEANPDRAMNVMYEQQADGH